MIKIEKVSVVNIDNAIRGARNPLNSWNKSDSIYDEKGHFILGENDMDLGRRLTAAGSSHRKFLRQIFVSADITAPLYWWKEYDTYKISTTANSCSTMHRIHSKCFSRDDFSHEKMSPGALSCLDNIIEYLEDVRKKYNENKDKAYWNDMIQLLPSSYNQMRTCTLTYETMINIYGTRRMHKLTEWREFCSWIETLPYFDNFILPGVIDN